MSTSILVTKLFIPPTRPEIVRRPRLIEQLNDGLHRKLTLISAPAGFGKTTLLSDWVNQVDLPTAWLSLDKGDNELNRFLIYVIAALQTVNDNLCRTIQAMLQAPQPVPMESIVTEIINEVAALSQNLVLILEDYHVVEDGAIHESLTFMIEHLPPSMHLVISSRSDPFLPLSRMRAHGQLTELRTEDLRFSIKEATIFLNRVMELSLSEIDIRSLETRTEGWIVGLQLAAISLQGKEDTTELIKSFSGSHRLVLDYLIEEVLEQQSESVQSFLLQTSVLDRMSGSLCDALTGQENGQQTLEMLEQANLFIVPLDNERCWYRYHHLFADLLRQRLHRSTVSSAGGEVAELHKRASEWYEDNGLEIEAFQHAAAANDVERAERLIEGEGVPLQYRGAAAVVLKWLESLPTSELDARPSLWVAYASALNLTGQPPEAEGKLQAAEAALKNKMQDAKSDDKTKDIVGHIAAIRAMLGVGQHRLETIVVQSQLALEYLNPDNLPLRTITAWTLGYAYQLQGDRAAANQAYNEVLSISQASGDIISTLAATTGLGNIYESENKLYLAAESYRRGRQLFGDQPEPLACGVFLGPAQIFYEWNELDEAEQNAQQSLQMARQVQGIDTPALCWVLLARLRLAQRDLAGADGFIDEAEQFVYQHNFTHRIPEVAAAQVLALLHKGDLSGAADLATNHDIPSSRARVHLAKGAPSEALAILDPERQRVDAKGWEAERLKVMVLQAVALHAHGEKEGALGTICEALALAEPGGIIRTFVDEGPPMRRLLQEIRSRAGDPNIQISTDYVRRLLKAFSTEKPKRTDPLKPELPVAELLEPLSDREMEVLRYLKSELSGPEIAQELTIALSTFQSHTKNIYIKLDVNSRRAAVIRAEILNLI